MHVMKGQGQWFTTSGFLDFDYGLPSKLIKWREGVNRVEVGVCIIFCDLTNGQSIYTFLDFEMENLE